jgi:hypothetical protein
MFRCSQGFIQARMSLASRKHEKAKRSNDSIGSFSSLRPRIAKLMSSKSGVESFIVLFQLTPKTNSGVFIFIILAHHWTSDVP